MLHTSISALLNLEPSQNYYSVSGLHKFMIFVLNKETRSTEFPNSSNPWKGQCIKAHTHKSVLSIGIPQGWRPIDEWLQNIPCHKIAVNHTIYTHAMLRLQHLRRLVIFSPIRVAILFVRHLLRFSLGCQV